MNYLMGGGVCSVLVSPFNPETMDGTIIRAEDNKAIELVLGKWQDENFDYANAFKTVNMYKFTRDFMSNLYAPLIRWYVENVGENIYYEKVLGSLIYYRENDIQIVKVPESMWCEIDNEDDLFRARRRFRGMINALGIVGGMGSYATVDFFRRIIDAFPAQKEWERPRIIIDNFCTMPSRVRAILYNERRDELIKDLSSSVRNLLKAGAERIIFACNTSHVFIPEVILRVPECADKIINIIEACAREISVKITNGGGGLTLIATEGTIETGIYDKVFGDFGMQINSPDSSQYEELRYFIEAVKQNIIDAETLRKFHDFVMSFETDGVILGCTEIPILYRECLKNNFTFTKKIYDPLQSAINILVILYRKF